MRIRKTSVLITLLASSCLLALTLLGSQSRQLKKMVKPVYPPAALQMKVQGTVKLEAVVDRAGNVTNVIFVSGHALLKSTAMDCVKQWKYEPSDVLSLVPVEIVFKLPD